MFGKKTVSFDELDLRVISLLSEVIAQFAKDQALDSVPVLKRIDIKQGTYTKRGVKMINADVSGYMLYGNLVIRFSTRSYGDFPRTFWLDSLIWLKFAGTEGHIYPLTGTYPGNCGVGGWGRNPVVFQQKNKMMTFKEALAALPAQ